MSHTEHTYTHTLGHHNKCTVHFGLVGTDVMGGAGGASAAPLRQMRDNSTHLVGSLRHTEVSAAKALVPPLALSRESCQ